ncbi:MAG: IS66 family insertion sequence element accessory protein TnpB [Planctomycetaceae bacterium]|nr:IS66 family insertion sequence element accessory protein TnpB [Planctomycetales bacterium]MCB9872680.1 IS66 family insertion sequence element accessory protein TnpB [Planctomycetaceae bacterium]MCB9926165.1 IS66 family insertion sequence element accessory protein TnpB [Planctomycetaceae bacterium]
MIPLSTTVRIFVFTGVTDMRKSFNGLSGQVVEHFDVELLSGHLFLFFNRRRTCVKALHWDNDGLVIWYKRLEAGTFQLPTAKGNAVDEQRAEIDHTDLSLLLSGIDLTSAKRRKRYQVAG